MSGDISVLMFVLAANMAALALYLAVMLFQSMLPLRIAGPTSAGVPIVALTVIGLLLGAAVLIVGFR